MKHKIFFTNFFIVITCDRYMLYNYSLVSIETKHLENIRIICLLFSTNEKDKMWSYIVKQRLQSLLQQTPELDIAGLLSGSGFQFSYLGEDRLEHQGIGFMDSAGTAYSFVYDTPLMTIPFPLGMGADWSDTSTLEFSFRVENPSPSQYLPGDSIDVDVDTELARVGTVDAWGQMILTLGAIAGGIPDPLGGLSDGFALTSPSEPIAAG